MKWLFIAIIGLSAKLVVAQTIEFSIYFDSNKSEPRAEQVQGLDSLLAVLDPERIISISLVGHADTTSNRQYNKTLARRRVETVSKYLISHGIPDSMLIIASKGDLTPIGDNRSEEGRALNRRVILTITKMPDSEDPNAHPHHNDPTHCSHKDTVICFPSTNICIRTNECQLLCCTYGITHINRDLLLRSPLNCNKPDGSVLGIIAAFRLNPQWPCEAEKLLDPSWILTVPVPPDVSPQHVSLEYFDYDGSWIPPPKQTARMKVKKTKDGHVMEISVQRLIAAYVVCAYKLTTHKVQLKLPLGADPQTLMVYTDPVTSALWCRKERGRTWVCSLPCTDSYTLRVYGQREGFGTYIDFRNLDHRVQLFGKECPCTESQGKRLLGLVPTKGRKLYRKYSAEPEDLQTVPVQK